MDESLKTLRASLVGYHNAFAGRGSDKESALIAVVAGLALAILEGRKPDEDASSRPIASAPDYLDELCFGVRTNVQLECFPFAKREMRALQRERIGTVNQTLLAVASGTLTWHRGIGEKAVAHILEVLRTSGFEAEVDLALAMQRLRGDVRA